MLFGYDPPEGMTYYIWTAVYALIFFITFAGGNLGRIISKGFFHYREPEDDDQLSIVISTGSDWDDICQAAIYQAKNGDHRAREWLVKHVYNSENTVGNSDHSKNVIEQDRKIVKEAILALRSLGFKAKECKLLLSDLVKTKKFDKVEDLVRDALSAKHQKGV